ncbi:hypothetical protein [Oryzihumus leptocrescens]|uniref:Uncharacterized protein n=1 Tax=Oryzihumus leptocrescens TaxID=297536 RepID=A0A542ZKL4_9MICO|nr:hypothetical protein [Oryzihumus leptocrescens]TQL60839.1 hypothetical protein FB474_2239 [Oryzihumus leptocrescens]
MDVPWRSGRHGRGVLLVRGRSDAVAAWSRRGLLPVHVLPLPGWTAVVPAGPSRARAPYDDALTVLAARPVPSRLRAAVGLFRVEDRAVVSLQPGGWRAIQRWVVWEPGHGVVRSSRLPTARPDELVAAAGLRDRRAVRDVAGLLHDAGGEAGGLLASLMEVLDLPGQGVLADPLSAAGAEGSRLVEPDEAHLATFDSIVTDEARLRAEMEGH